MENTKQRDGTGCLREGDEASLDQDRKKKKCHLQMKYKICFEKSILRALACCVYLAEVAQ